MLKILGVIIIVILFNIPNLLCQSYSLNWKLNDKKTLIYKTIMNNIEDQDTFLDLIEELNIQDSIFDEKKTNKIKNHLEKISKFQNEFDYYSFLEKNQNIINIKIISVLKKEKSIEDSLEVDSTDIDFKFEEFKNYNQRVLLRGSIYENGAIHSFWLGNTQKNLLSILFQLPDKQVKVGDKWNLDLNLISNDENFICDSSFKINEVKFINVKKKENEIIAVLTYKIQEYVSGIYHIENSKFLYGREIEDRSIKMDLSFFGYAEFSITQGKWLVYDGFMVSNNFDKKYSKEITNFKLELEE